MKEIALNIQDLNDTLGDEGSEVVYTDEERVSEVQRLNAKLEALAQDEAVLTYIREQLLPNAFPDNVKAYVKGLLSIHSNDNELTDDQNDAIAFTLKLATENGRVDEVYAA